MKIIEKYKSAIETSDEHLLHEVFAPQVVIEFPAGTSDSLPPGRASYMLTQIAQTASGIKYALTADAGNNWYFLGFECQIENQKLQGIDQLHLNKDGKIDQLIAYMRPVPVVQRFEELIGQRLRACGVGSGDHATGARFLPRRLALRSKPQIANAFEGDTQSEPRLT